MKKFIIPAPFGNYFNYSNATSTIGTFTRHYRGGLWKRAWRMFLTLRYNWRSQTWINKLRLPNPGIDSVINQFDALRILSVLGYNEEEWQYLIERPSYKYIELNLGCPNINHRVSVTELAKPLQATNKIIIAKLPPIRWMDYGYPLYALGVRYFHLCNTIQTPGGGLSGKVLKQYSFWAIEDFRRAFGDTVTLIGGGGVTSKQDVKDYENAGANHVSIGSMHLNPFNWKKIKEIINA